MDSGSGWKIEPRSNIDHKCDEHAPHPDPQYFQKPLTWFVGRLCKIGFDVNNPAHPDIAREHMWIAVEEVDGEKLRGRIDNDPFYTTEFACGDEVVFDRTDIEAVYEE
jgi:hypothetical protein